MFDPDYVLLYVANPLASEAFYRRVLGRTPVESSPTFVMFVLGSGVKIGLWTATDVSPAATARPGATELAFTLKQPSDVDATCEAWRAAGTIIAQEPTDLDFGRAFLALDLDGHRLRVFCPPPR
jgi:catechol 2,3-dioxygenase-like lactoylglutathione lyase family enzyme